MAERSRSSPMDRIPSSVKQDEIRRFYDEVYHKNAQTATYIPWHYQRLAARIGSLRSKRLLDVGCGTGQWLTAATRRGAVVAGIDISERAIETCRKTLPDADLRCGSAETLPFEDRRFDFVSCLGSLEHFLNPESSLREMVRVAKGDAKILLLVPNADFLTRRLGLYHGTEQANIREDIRTLAGWKELFESAGLQVVRRWKDLHVLSWSWIRRGKWYLRPLRAAQALALPLWPLSWQYQVYHLCEIRQRQV